MNDPTRPIDAAALADAWRGWMAATLTENRMPLSGNVEQWIRSWGQAAAQVGVVNFNVAGSRDPALERQIGSQYSYGRQLGRILEVLLPLVERNAGAFDDAPRQRARDDFLAMAREIAAIKQRRSLEALLEEVEAMRDQPGFEAQLEALIGRLQVLQSAGPPR